MIVIPLCMYVGSYLVLVKRKVTQVYENGQAVVRSEAQYAKDPDYEEFLEGLLTPIHAADRILRANYWADRKVNYHDDAGY